MASFIDLSQTIETGMQLFPLHSPTHVIPWAPREQYGWATNALFLNEHAGTHLDAPYHFVDGGVTIEGLELSQLTGPAIALDFREKWPGGPITADDLKAATETRAVEPGDAVILATGAAPRHGAPEYLDAYPGLSADGAAFLVEAGARLVGTDAASIDLPEAVTFPAHHTLLPAGVLVVENLTNLEAIFEAIGADAEFLLHTFPLRISGGTGSPIRAVAVLGDGR